MPLTQPFQGKPHQRRRQTARPPTGLLVKVLKSQSTGGNAINILGVLPRPTASPPPGLTRLETGKARRRVIPPRTTAAMAPAALLNPRTRAPAITVIGPDTGGTRQRKPRRYRRPQRKGFRLTPTT